MNRTIYFDMDGTIANLYGVQGWLEDLISHNARPYKEAVVMWNMSLLARILNQLQKKGYKIGIISWLAKNSTAEYDEIVTNTKLAWLNQHLHSVNFDVIHIVEYGTPKENFATTNDILFDDEKNNRDNWCGIAYNEKNIINILKEML
jgi:phosphoglycolate phosphatase-like HAD superfamily hydrolase